MSVRWGTPGERPAMLESGSWLVDVLLVIVLLCLAAGLGAGVAG